MSLLFILSKGAVSRNGRLHFPPQRAGLKTKKASALQRKPFLKPSLREGYFLALQPHPQPEDFSSFLTMHSLPPQSAHFLGLHLVSLVAPHFSHLNTAIVLPPLRE